MQYCIYWYSLLLWYHDHCLIVKVIQIAKSQIFLLIWLIHKDCSLFQTFTVYTCSIRDLAFTLVYWFGADCNLWKFLHHLQGACVFVAVLLHYLFTTVFFWMLCEGIMLYLMLVVVFNRISKKWWIFFIIGWGNERSFLQCTILMRNYVVHSQPLSLHAWLN